MQGCGIFKPHQWEFSIAFKPESIDLRQGKQYVNILREKIDIECPPGFSFAIDDFQDKVQEDLVIYDQNHFVAGNLHNNVSEWEKIIEYSQYDVLNWIRNKIDIHDFMQRFKGEFWGMKYNYDYPPPRHFKNASNCQQFKEFINTELTSRLKSGAISYIGRVEDVQPPHIVSPITIEPSKPRLCINLMYLNCFMKDTPFSLDTLSDVPETIKDGCFLTKLDDASGYDNVLMSEASRTLLGFQWGGHYFTCNTLPFGWKNSAYVYHTINLQAISYLRNHSIACLLYIDDRLIEAYNGEVSDSLNNAIDRSRIAIHIAVQLFVKLGYFLNLSKSMFEPTQNVVFLGMIIDTVQRSFFITQKRKLKFINLRKTILQSNSVTLTTIQKFTGLCISMVVAIPAAKLYTSVCNRAIANAVHTSNVIKVEGELREEIAYWRFLDTWDKPFTWISERHYNLTLSTDS